MFSRALAASILWYVVLSSIKFPAGSGAGYAVPIAVTFGILFPTVLGAAYGDVMGGFIYPGLVARLLSAFSGVYL
jgi:hypothetical protein